MTIDLLVQKTVVHNFLRIPQSTFPTLPSTVEMKSSRSSTQTMTSFSSNIVQSFVLIPFVESSQMTIYLLVQKTVVKGYWQPKFLLCYLKVLTHLRMNMVLIPRQSLLFKSYSYVNSPKFWDSSAILKIVVKKLSFSHVTQCDVISRVALE